MSRISTTLLIRMAGSARKLKVRAGEGEEGLRVDLRRLDVGKRRLAVAGRTVGSELVLVHVDVARAAVLHLQVRLVEPEFDMAACAQYVGVTGRQLEDRVCRVVERGRRLERGPLVGAMAQRAVRGG